MFSEAKARRVTQFIECLRHTKGEFHGQPFKLLPWQEKVIRDVFGTVRDDDPTTRQYTTAYIEIPKKNGKSELGAAIALNMLCKDDEWCAEALKGEKFCMKKTLPFFKALLLWFTAAVFSRGAPFVKPLYGIPGGTEEDAA